MLGEESTTRIIIDTFDKAGFDINRDLLQSYKFIEGRSLPQWRDVGYGGGIYFAGGGVSFRAEYPKLSF